MTTWVERFQAAMALLCDGRRPTEIMIFDWFVGDGEELQQWASENGSLGWHQGIALIDAACTIADQPEEGAGHLDRNFEHWTPNEA
jgi:hypothetical protein